MEEQIADHEAENGVPQKLEGLVVADVLVPRLVRERLVSECPVEDIPAAERIPDETFEFGQVALHSDGSITALAGRGSRQRCQGLTCRLDVRRIPLLRRALHKSH